jgi:putative transposase
VQDSQASDRCHYWAKLVLIWHTNGTLQFSNQTNRAISIAVDVHWGLAGRWSRVFVGKRYQPEQGRNLLRQIKVVWRTAGSSTSVQGTRYRGADVLRWRKEEGGPQVDQAQRLKKLEQGERENKAL